MTRTGGRGGGLLDVLLGILGGDVPPCSQNPDSISDQKHVIFYTRFQTWPLKSILVLGNYLYEIMHVIFTIIGFIIRTEIRPTEQKLRSQIRN